ncbi:lysM domain receptor-like kinase 3 [Senna tora]|uniref:LysM domain receptor-like kinase 3 n=1 Tax=Senna tora TaxID=362788 RepID=A0A834SMY5_9FABA|nr:lysM domain receptor-like kinase 3 [Senna tora]
MCKTKMAVNASDPTSSPRNSRTPRPRSSSSRPTFPTASSSSSDPSTSYTSSAAYSGSTGYRLSSDTSISSRTSLTTLRDTLPENPHIYHFSEICSATNNFLAKRYSSSSSTPSWRCSLSGRDVIVFQRKFRRKLETAQLRERLSVICRSHHVSIIKLLGVSISGDYIYLVYEFVNGANLSDCLRNKKNPQFTVLSNWISRMQVATDLAHGLDYIHNKTGFTINFVHNHIKSSGIIVTEPSFNAKICHFGAAQLCGEIDEENERAKEVRIGEIVEEPSSPLRSTGFEGVRGYMSPEYQSTGVATQKSDVYAFGVVMLELLSGEEPLKFKFNSKTGEFVTNSVIDTAAAVIGSGSDGVEGRLRKWLDRKLKDSFPVDVAEEVTRVALECVHVDPDKRPNMGRVAGKISRLYLKSKIWCDNMRMPTDISVSLAPR